MLRTVPTDSRRAAEAYASGLWVTGTLADSLREAASATPDREVLVDGPTRLDCRTLHDRATALAAAMLERIPVGSVVSFMLPNWHEAAIVYHAATLAGMVVNPILPSLRDHELSFILADADVRMIFVPAAFGGHDYPAMLARVTADMTAPRRSWWCAARRQPRRRASRRSPLPPSRSTGRCSTPTRCG